MKYLTIQPDTPYFHWQLLVLHNNMQELGMFDDSITVIGYDHQPSIWSIEYQMKYPSNVLLVQDTRDQYSRQYISSIRPHLLSKIYQNLTGSSWMYHDSDILFTKEVNWNEVVKCQSCTYVSDTVSYIGADYIRSKGEGLLNEMCKVVGIDPKTVIENEYNSGGAQYIFGKNVRVDWEKIEKDSVNLFRLMNETAYKYTPEHPVQSWTADMWALLWNIWLSGKKSKVIPELSFSWATDEMYNLDKYNIHHNAGVSGTEPDLFYKGAFTEHFPFERDFGYVNKEKCSYRYVQEIQKVSRIYQYGQEINRQSIELQQNQIGELRREIT